MITPDEVAKLAELYDRFANALDPFSEERATAKRQFYSRLELLHEREGQGIAFETIRLEMVRQCKDYLKKNQPRPPSPKSD